VKLTTFNYLASKSKKGERVVFINNMENHMSKIESRTWSVIKPSLIRSFSKVIATGLTLAEAKSIASGKGLKIRAVPLKS